MIEVLWWGFVLRLVQALLQAAPTILIGLLIAGIFRRLVGYGGTRRLFGHGTRRAFFHAWVIGMLLPVCSLGVFPILRQLRLAGLSGGTILAFALTAPLFNPISVLYGLTLSSPVVILVFCLCCLTIVSTIGLLWDRLYPDTAVGGSEPAAATYGIKRMLAVAVTAADDLVSNSSKFLWIGLIGAASLSILLPMGYLQEAAEHDDPWAPLFMTLVAAPAYTTPMAAMVQVASMFEHGNSVGAAFALLTLGAGVNIGLIAWMIRAYSTRRTVVGFSLLWVMVLVLAYAVDKPLYPHGVNPPGHTHAFDAYCCPFLLNEPEPFRRMWATLGEHSAPWETQALTMLSLLAVGGIFLRRTGVIPRLEAWFQQQPKTSSGYDIVLPGPVLGGVALVGLIGFSVLGCYIYYPPPSEIFEEMRIINTEIVVSANSQDWDATAYWIPIQEDWTRKLQVSMQLRGHSISSDQREQAVRLLAALDSLEHALDDSAVEVIREKGRFVDQAYRSLRAAYQTDISR